MSAPCTIPLHRSYWNIAEWLLGCRRFDTDTLLIAAEAFDELELERRLDGLECQAAEAASLAARLRDEAPRRQHPPRCRIVPLSFLDRVIRAQSDASDRCERINTGEAILRAARQEQAERSFHVAGGAR